MRYALIGLLLFMSGRIAYGQPDYTSAEYCDPWCLTAPDGGGAACFYRTLDQCRATRYGLGGDCVRNPFLSLCRRPGSQSQSRSRRTRRDQ